MNSADNSNKPASALLTDPYVVRFWLRMSEMHGNLWVSAYGETASELWASAIKSLTGQQIKHGLDCLIKRGEKYPPSLPEFVALCKSYQPPVQQIPIVKKPRSSKETAAIYISEMRKTLH